MVANTAKPIALSPIFEPDEADELQADFNRIAEASGLKIFREDAFLLQLCMQESLPKENHFRYL